MAKTPGAPRSPLRQGDVRVRMYCHGFGDCFLLSFGRDPEPPFHIVIDCGLLMGDGRKERIIRAVENIRETTDRHVDVLAVTHEHADHLSGFTIAKPVWNQIAIDELWFAWTERPGDDVAATIRRHREERKKGLVRAKKALGTGARSKARKGDARSPLAPRASAQIDVALEFFGVGSKDYDTTEALKYLAERRRSPKYWNPGELIPLKELPGVRVYVLGPPRDEKALKKDKPSARRPEVYHLAGGLAAEAGYFAALGAPEDGGRDNPARRGAKTAPPPGADDAHAADLEETRWIRACPFDGAFRIPLKKREDSVRRPEERAFLRKHYIARTRTETAKSRAGEAKWTESQDWRQITDEWLATGGSLAMKLDEDTNNTSLVLAFELIESGKVLLFVGDAQVGNWLSWDSLLWEVPDRSREGKATVTVADLLARTVLYKVGHHGSHNATLSEKGLERMTSPDLVAMLPVIESVAHDQGRKGWNMPFPPLYDRLREKTNKRVYRADHRLVPTNPPGGSARVEETDLYIDYIIEADA